MNNDALIRPAGESDLDGLAILLEELTGVTTDRVAMGERFARMKAASNYHVCVAN